MAADTRIIVPYLYSLQEYVTEKERTMSKTNNNILDSHIHLWDNVTYHYPWPPKQLKQIFRQFLVTDLEEAMTKSPVRRAMFIQVNQTYEETDWILKIAEENSTLVGVIGWVDLQDPQLEIVLDKYMKFPKFKGVRNILEAEPDNDWLGRAEVQRGLGLLEKKGLTYDLLVRERHFKLASTVVKKFPKLKFVVDHIAKPQIKDRIMDGWKEGIAELAKNPNVYCKLSGMVTEADLQNWTVDDLKPFVQHVLSVFGADRCMFGSDWPVCTMAGATYYRVYEAYAECLSGLSEDEKTAIFCKNCARFYNLD